ncbi:MAG TPA: GNAT family N-acetyltransferase [Bacteroidia bacterium]|jgi:GNAT superfamily N-acetyltransferase|nr:GNAT family N-acetyltransferase [Bacteroidia bacterium]
MLRNEIMNPEKETGMEKNDNEVRIVEYLPQHRARFKEINEQWITRLYVMEEEDIKTVEDPESYVLKGGGKIFIALYKGYPVGTCAYLNMGDHVYEMIKMAVDENYRGLKIGKKIGEESVQRIKELGAKKIILFSNRKGSATAIQLYHKLGFTEVPLGNSEFIRADIKMELNFD